MITEDAGRLVLPAKGLVTVELADADTGRIQYRETAENFISAQSVKVAKWWQRMMWGMYNPNSVSDALGTKPTEMPWFPAQHIACWNDAATEAPLTEDRLVGPITAWASRHPVGSPVGKRGVVNIGESTFSDASSKWVFDWTTTAGNGTFQSVGWTRLHEVSGLVVPRFPDDDAILPVFNPPLYGSSMGHWWDADTSSWLVCVNSYTGGSTFTGVIGSVPAAGGTMTVAMTPAARIYWNTGASEQNALGGVAKIGTDFIVGARNQSTGGSVYPRLMRLNAAGAVVWSTLQSAMGSASFVMDLTIDGSGNIWSVCDNDAVVRRHSPTDGTITASVTPALGLAATGMRGVAYDPNDGNFWVSGTMSGSNGDVVFKMDSSGNTITAVTPYSIGSQASQPSTTPYAGTYAVPKAGAREPYAMTWWSNTTSVAGSTIAPIPFRTSVTTTGPTPTMVTALAMKGTDLWAGNMAQAASGGQILSALRGGTLGTRSRLSTPQTKLSSQTMKIVYQFDFA